MALVAMGASVLHMRVVGRQIVVGMFESSGVSARPKDDASCQSDASQKGERGKRRCCTKIGYEPTCQGIGYQPAGMR